jgi:hypothetical protein
MVNLVDVLGELLSAAATGGTWRALLGLLASLPVAAVAYLALPEGWLRLSITGGAILVGVVTGLVWEWKAGEPSLKD